MASPRKTPGEGISSRLASRDTRVATAELAPNDRPDSVEPNLEHGPRKGSLRTAHPMLRALARAREEREVARLLFNAPSEPGLQASQGLPDPVRATLRQLEQAGRRFQDSESGSQGSPKSGISDHLEAFRVWAPQLVRDRERESSRARSPEMKQVLQGGDARVGKLASKLQDLILVVEKEHALNEAKRRVRLAEDSAEALAEASPGASGGEPEPLDLDQVVDQVVDGVKQEQEKRRQRCSEDSNGW